MYIYAGKCVSEGDCVRTLTCCWVKIMLVQKYTSVGGVALQLNGAVCWKGQQLINDDSAAKKKLDFEVYRGYKLDELCVS